MLFHLYNHVFHCTLLTRTKISINVSYGLYRWDIELASGSSLAPKMLHLWFLGVFFKMFFLMHGGCPPASITQSGLTTGKSVHGEPKSKARKSIYDK